MNRGTWLSLLEGNPVIAAVKDSTGLDRALQSAVSTVFILYGSLLDLAGITERVRAADKACLVHLDLIDGLAAREVSVEFVARSTAADGILTTKTALAKTARACGLLSVQRYFLLDSLALDNINKHPADGACAIEVLPGLMPGIIRRIVASVSLPVIAGGLIAGKEDVVAALSAGALGVSSTNPAVWAL